MTDTRRILKQDDDLRGDEEMAKQKAVYTWNKDEIAWRYCNTVHSVERVLFTGERWLIGNKWRYEKIYQFKIMSSSSRHHNEGEMTHDGEDAFFETFESACEYAINHLNLLLDYNAKCLLENIEEITSYKLKENTFEKNIITEKIFNEKNG